MKPTLIKKILLLLLFFSIATYSQWYNTSQGLPAWDNLGWQLDACSNNDVFIAFTSQGEHNLYKTTDGGNNWIELTLPAGEDIEDISYVNPQHIWGVSAYGRKIWFSSDSGTTWIMQKNLDTLTSFMNYIEMFDSLDGVAMGDAPSSNKPALFLSTTDGGNNWRSMNDTCLIGLSSGDCWRRIDFININTGYFYSFGESPQKLYKTTDSGRSWFVINENMGCQVLKFYNENIGIVRGQDCSGPACVPIIYRTIDGGENWEEFEINPTAWSDDIEFLPGDPSKVWYATLEELFFSSDSGKTWQEDPLSNTFSYGRALKFTDNTHGWFLAENVYKDTTGDHVTAFKETFNLPPKDFQLNQNYPNPFNPTTSISYSIKDNGKVQLIVYDMLGREVAQLVNEEKLEGSYSVQFNASNLPSGIYFYRLTSGNFSEVKKLILLK